MHSENGNAVIPSNELSVDAEVRSSDPSLATCAFKFTAIAVVILTDRDTIRDNLGLLIQFKGRVMHNW